MKKCNCAATWALIFSLVNFAIIVCMLVRVCWRPVSPDYQTFLVSVLSILVTILVFYQLFVSISAERRVKELEKRVYERLDDYEKRQAGISERIRDAQNDAVGLAFLRYADDEVNDGRKFFLLLDALYSFRGGTGEYRDKVDIAEKTLSEISERQTLLFTDNDFNKVEVALSKIDKILYDKMLAVNLKSKLDSFVREQKQKKDESNNQKEVQPLK